MKPFGKPFLALTLAAAVVACGDDSSDDGGGGDPSSSSSSSTGETVSSTSTSSNTSTSAGGSACQDDCRQGEVTCTDGQALNCALTQTPDGACYVWQAPQSCTPSNACLMGSCIDGTGCENTPVICDDPPMTECIDPNTLRVWDTTGLCGDGQCSYEQHDIDCPNCPSCDPCESVTCDNPPSECFAAAGTCTAGSCSYGFANGATCDDGDACTLDDSCDSGVCAGTPMSCAHSCEAGTCVGLWTPTSVAACPEERYDHSVIWTGTHMIVWGGDAGGAGNVLLNTGGRYNPATNSWASTSLVGAPSPRFRHVAVWTNAEMIVWGGYDGTGFDTGGRYNPATNTWTGMSTTGAPPTSEEDRGVWTGSEMIVWSFGGGGRYSPASDTWTNVQTAGAPSARHDHTLVWTGSEMIVWGGFSSPANTSLDTGGRYHAGSGMWTNTSTLGAPAARGGHTAVWTGTEMIVWGGYDGGGQALNTGGRYNPVSDTWTALPTANAPAPRFEHTMVWTGANAIVWGGIASNVWSNTGASFDSVTGAWTTLTLTGAPSVRSSHSALWSGSEMIVWGGTASNSPLFTGGRYAP